MADAPLHRHLSEATGTALEDLDGITADLLVVERRAGELEAEVEQGASGAALARLVAEVAQLNGTVSNLQCRRLDAVLAEGVVSGKREVRQRRKRLTQRCDQVLDLLERIHDLAQAPATPTADGVNIPVAWPTAEERAALQEKFLRVGDGESSLLGGFATSVRLGGSPRPEVLLLDAECAADRGDLRATSRIMADLTELLVVRAHGAAKNA